MDRLRCLDKFRNQLKTLKRNISYFVCIIHSWLNIDYFASCFIYLKMMNKTFVFLIVLISFFFFQTTGENTLQQLQEKCVADKKRD